jgi:hypothetical protein
MPVMVTLSPSHVEHQAQGSSALAGTGQHYAVPLRIATDLAVIRAGGIRRLVELTGLVRVYLFALLGKVGRILNDSSLR